MAKWEHANAAATPAGARERALHAAIFGHQPAAWRAWAERGDATAPPDAGAALLGERLAWQFPHDAATARRMAAERFGEAAVAGAAWERWVHDGTAQSLALWGGRRFARSFLGNLARWRPELTAAAGAPAGAGGGVGGDDAAAAGGAPAFDLVAHVREVVAAARAAGRRDGLLARRHTVTHRLEVRQGATPPGRRVRCWLPFPAEDGRQHAIALAATSDATARVAPRDAIHRCVQLEATADGDGAAAFAITHAFTTSALAPPDAGAAPPSAPAAAPDARDLAAALDRDEPAFAVADETLARHARALRAAADPRGDAPLAAARAVYGWVRAECRYVAEVEYGLLRSLAAKGWATREGDCGILAALFIALCRAAGVPARWRSGWFLKPAGGNMHDWAEFFAAPWGWLPCDPTYGPLDDPDPAVRDFFCGGLDAWRFVANLGVAAPLGVAPGALKRHPRSEPFDFQRGEVETESAHLFFPAWSARVTWTSDPAA